MFSITHIFIISAWCDYLPNVGGGVVEEQVEYFMQCGTMTLREQAQIESHVGQWQAAIVTDVLPQVQTHILPHTTCITPSAIGPDR